MRFIQDTDTIKINNRDVIPFAELLTRRENLLRSMVFKYENGAQVLDVNNVKGFRDGRGNLITNENYKIINNEVDINNVVLNDNAQKMFNDRLVIEYQDLRSQWYKASVDKYKKGNFADVNSSVVNMKKFIEFISGKAGGVGQSAVHITNHQLGAAANLYLNNTNPLWIFDHNTTTINGVDYPSFANIRGKDGELISETLSAFLNAYVDVAKDPYIYSINAISKTANMTFMMIRAGAPIKWIGRFLSQPVIKDFLQAQNQNESMAIRANNLQRYESEIVKDVLSNYTTNIELLHKGRKKYDREYNAEFDRLVLEDKLDELKPYNDVLSATDKIAWNRVQELMKSGLFSYEKLGDYIAYDSMKKDGVEIPQQLKHIEEYYPLVQSVMLDLYLEYQRQSKHLQSLIRATNADTSGIGQSRKAIEDALNETKRVFKSQMFGNAEKMIENTIVNKFQEAREKTYKMYSNLYLVDKTPILKKSALKLYQLYSPYQFGKDKLKLDDTISNDMIMALMSVNYPDLGNVTQDVYESLVVPTEQKGKYKDANNKVISLPQFINNLLDKNADYNDSTDDIKKYWPLRNNKLIKKLSGYVSTNPLNYKSFLEKNSIVIGKPSVNYIKYNKSRGITEELNADTEALQEIKEKYPDFYNDLIKFEVFQNGFNVTPNSFVNDIPNVDIMNMKNDAVSRFLDLTSEQQEDVLEQFISQFKRRNLKYNPGIKSVTKKFTQEEGYKKYRSAKGYGETVPMLVGDEIVEIPNSKYIDFEILVGVKKNANNTYSRVSVSGRLNKYGNYNFDIGKGEKRPIVGEEMYFTGYQIELLNPEEASNRSLKRIEIEKIKEQKRNEKEAIVAAQKESAITNVDMSYSMDAKDNIYNKKITTLELAEQGLRTSTTRTQKLGVIGNLVTFEGRPQVYKITDSYRITSEMVNDPQWVKNWSQREGWTTDYFYKKLNDSNNKTIKVGSFVTLYEKLEPKQMSELDVINEDDNDPNVIAKRMLDQAKENDCNS
jgi:hypothetical protein